MCTMLHAQLNSGRSNNDALLVHNIKLLLDGATVSNLRQAHGLNSISTFCQACLFPAV